ncbi:hypothetical protein PAHAL_9G230900 [Panicum hallii]|uniref:Uncharacterized protein n=1 Tax=Panicum hallii TaxID=206008 RepID=A0A2T8I282_9POAL|nr:hypothetical protein PAHAL_9G230900 [Panicum hallii]
MEQPFDAEFWVKYIEMAADFGKEQPWQVELDGAAMGKLDDADRGQGIAQAILGHIGPSAHGYSPSQSARHLTRRLISALRQPPRGLLRARASRRRPRPPVPEKGGREGRRRREGGVAEEAIADQSRAPPPVKSATAAPSPTDSSNPRRGWLTTASSCRW